MKPLADNTEEMHHDIERVTVLDLRSIARVREIDRQLYRDRIGRWGARWIILPGLAIVGLMITQSIAPVWSEIEPGHVITLAASILTAATACLAASREIRRRRAELERERSILLGRTSGV
jgi:hypothetical protein